MHGNAGGRATQMGGVETRKGVGRLGADHDDDDDDDVQHGSGVGGSAVTTMIIVKLWVMVMVVDRRSSKWRRAQLCHPHASSPVASARGEGDVQQWGWWSRWRREKRAIAKPLCRWWVVVRAEWSGGLCGVCGRGGCQSQTGAVAGACWGVLTRDDARGPGLRGGWTRACRRRCRRADAEPWVQGGACRTLIDIMVIMIITIVIHGAE